MKIYYNNMKQLFKKHIFNSNPIHNNYNREYLFNKSRNTELNTYVTWGETKPQYDFTESYQDEYVQDGKGKVKKGDKKIWVGKDMSNAVGIKSIFNKYSIVFESNELRIGNNAPLIDTPETRIHIKENSDCSIKNLVEKSKTGVLGAETYDYSDFAYCKYLGRIPNNYMVTLRRFPIPINDFINAAGYNYSNEYPKSNLGNKGTPGSFSPPVSLGCMITWMGTPGNELENILKYDFNMPYKQMKSEMQNVSKSDDATPMNALFSSFDPVYQRQVQLGQAGSAVSIFGGPFKGCANAPYSGNLNHIDANKIYGPIDTINDTHIRSDEGLQFNHSFSLTFEYELRAYSNINTRQAMLDLLANILAVTYVTGDFWGGGVRGTGPHQSDLFSNLKTFKTFGGASEFSDSIIKDANTVFESVKASTVKAGGWVNLLKSTFNNFAGMLIGGALNNLGRPHKQALNSLLSPAPVGLWHVTIGNPFHPIMSIGNMILEKTTITHTGPLGLDDFPTGLKVVCDLKRAKGRDKRDIERLYLHGINRIYASVGDNIKHLYDQAPVYKEISKKDKDYDNIKNNYLTLYVDDANKEEFIANADKNNNLENLISVEKVYLRNFGTGCEKTIMLAAKEIAYGSQKPEPKEKTTKKK